MPSVRICQSCGERLDPEARQCACGWKVGGVSSDPLRWRCSASSGGDRCRFPGAMSLGIGQGAQFVCAFHLAGGSDADHFDRIIKASFDWDGAPDSYLALRAKFAKRAGAGSPMGGGDERPRAREIPPHIRELVQGFMARRK